MIRRILVLGIVLSIMGAVAYFFGVGPAAACGVTAVAVYVYSMARRYSGVQSARSREKGEHAESGTASMITTRASDSSGNDDQDRGQV
ncbi:hypothetical protein E7V67_001815 [[Empedobacter] haloabium]|uniref:Uncharacterized protein n=1 Tax=[Empedobacter] haloabium TaxID=592317 RepID=A0ABZ1UMY5_9BURK